MAIFVKLSHVLLSIYKICVYVRACVCVSKKESYLSLLQNSQEEESLSVFVLFFNRKFVWSRKDERKIYKAYIWFNENL